MKIKAVLFDLDGTLLPMDQDLFVKAYFGALAKRLAPLGYEPEKLMKVLWGGVASMVKNDGHLWNEDVFWNFFTAAYGEASLKDKPYIDEFYKVEFNKVQKVCGYSDKAKQIIDLVKEKGRRPVLATNPLFPHTATENRMRWAGLTPEQFELYTTYENSHFCKPNPKYYLEILGKIGCTPEECIMVGNDVNEDMMPAKALGMQVFLLTDCLINKENVDISEIPNGGFENLRTYLEEMMEKK